ncbi:WXG100 family type VII secretion target [Streptomyces sp. NPDC051684]|uniref:WXG100 family type VII secretion target n=1 Tax=Streptomyces sp. NPDC051684 TaxID=3365670 RepID=UPI0037A5FBBC
MTGYSVEPEVLRSAAKKIRDAVSDVDKLHLDELTEKTADFGHSEAELAFEQLMGTWHQALTKTLKDDAEESADKLADTAREYERQEQLVNGSFAAQQGPVLR